MTSLGVNVQDNPDNAQALMDETGVTYDQASDPRGFGVPTTLLVDADGTIRYRHTGAVDDAQLRRLLREHLRVAA